MDVLKKLIAEGEHQMQDFKFRIDDQKKIARTLVAFANTDGGRLLIGVKDNGKIAGVNPEEEFHMIQGAAQLYSRPVIHFESRIWQEDMRLVLEIKIEPDARRNYTALDEEGKWKSYIRRKDHTLIANKIILKIWKLEKQGLEKPAVFRENELKCLKLIAEHRSVTLSKIYRLLEIDKSEVDETVALLVYWKMIQMEFNEDGIRYSIAE